jgi:hypothetical protein
MIKLRKETMAGKKGRGELSKKADYGKGINNSAGTIDEGQIRHYI